MICVIIIYGSDKNSYCYVVYYKVLLLVVIKLLQYSIILCNISNSMYHAQSDSHSHTHALRSFAYVMGYKN